MVAMNKRGTRAHVYETKKERTDKKLDNHSLFSLFFRARSQRSLLNFLSLSLPLFLSRVFSLVVHIVCIILKTTRFMNKRTKANARGRSTVDMYAYRRVHTYSAACLPTRQVSISTNKQRFFQLSIQSKNKTIEIVQIPEVGNRK